MFFRKKRKDGGSPDAGGAGVSSSAAEAGDAPREHRISGAPSTQFLTGEAGQDRSTVQVLLEAIARVSESRDLEALLNDIVDRSIEITGAERGFLLLKRKEPDEGDDSLDVRVARMRGGKPVGGSERFSTSIANRVLTEVQALRATVQSESEALELGRSVFDLKLRAVMCVPLAAQRTAYDNGPPGEPLGVLYVDSRAATRQFSQRDLALFAALAQHISIALENARLHLDSIEKIRLEQSLELASAIQRDLMPRLPEHVTGYDVFGWYGPAEGTAGDFYDFVRAKDGRLGVLVGDVTGHGIGPALITATAQASLRSYLRLVGDPGEVVTLLNQDLCERVEDGRFLTLFLALLAPDGGVDCLNAGHTPPLVWRQADGRIEDIVLDGPALGMIADETYRAHERVVLERGDVLLVHTDGLSEARDPEDHNRMFGEEGVRRVLAETAARGASAKEITNALIDAAMQLAGGLREDDVTVVVARRQ
jgi:serine phosphatase RsbU (regulator of sigma subunit)